MVVKHGYNWLVVIFAHGLTLLRYDTNIVRVQTFFRCSHIIEACCDEIIKCSGWSFHCCDVKCLMASIPLVFGHKGAMLGQRCRQDLV